MKLPSTYSDYKTNVNVIVETPAGSRNKYAYDEDTKMFKLSKVLPIGLSFPCEFGFIPHTLGDDGDPIDVMVIMDDYTYPGCIIECRLLGVIKGTQQENEEEPYRNDRIFGVPVEMRDLDHVRQVNDIGKNKLDAIVKFMEYYNMMEDKVYKLIEIADADAAYALVKKHKK
jgi:inorganic pyrophosphatase